MKQDSVELWHTARLSLLRLWRYRPWVSGHAAALWRTRVVREPLASSDDDKHLRAAAAWLACAQDASGDGGVIGRYSLAKGWSSSYPETTGYIVPTFLVLAQRLDASYEERARNAVNFLLAVQLASGAFPAGEIGTNRTKPSPFNSAQIIHGLLAWHRHSGDAASLQAAHRAAQWLVSEQDGDGAWRRHFYHEHPASYTTYLSCWLAELGSFCGETAYLHCAERNLDWVLGQRDTDTGWLDGAGFTPGEQQLRVADLHATAYTIAGLFATGKTLGRADAIAAAMHAASGVAAALERLGWLPGVMDHQWRARANSACLTGNAQMALVWMDIGEWTGEARWLGYARAALELVKLGQSLDSSNPRIRGAIPGCMPMWGWYNDGTYPNWAAKFFIDALLRISNLTGPHG